MTEKRRRKTGCLTCRTRRVKCDERKPDCERCEAANVECAGYAEKRRVKIRRPEQSATVSATESYNGSTSILPVVPVSIPGLSGQQNLEKTLASEAIVFLWKLTECNKVS